MLVFPSLPPGATLSNPTGFTGTGAPFIAFNEPETSLHPELLEPLARMIVRAAERTQIWVVTHSERLAAAFAACGEVVPIRTDRPASGP